MIDTMPQDVKDTLVHGSRTTYVRYECRCQACTEANTEYNRKAISHNQNRQARKRVKGIDKDPDLIHGRAISYTWHGCRCDECTEAVREYWREEKQILRLINGG